MTNILLIPNWSVSNVIVDEHDTYQITAAYDFESHACKKCKTICRLIRRGTVTRTYVDAPVHGRHTYIHVRRNRYTCPQCGACVMQSLPGMHRTRRMTKRLVEYIEKQSLLKPIAHVAEDTGVAEGTVREISKALFTYMLEKHERNLRAPRHIGIDELTLGKKQLRAIFVNLEDSWPFEMLPNRSLQSVQNFLMTLPNRQDVETVTMDMWDQYRTAVKRTMPQAAVIADRWHMADKVNDAMNEARRRYQRKIHLDRRTALKSVNGIFLKRRAELSASEELELGGWLANSSELYSAYAAKEALLSIWDLHDRAAAEAALDEWRASIADDNMNVFAAVATTIDNWRTEILNFFDHGRLTNGPTEARNGAIKRIYNYSGSYDFQSIRARALFGKRPERLKQEAEAKDKAYRAKKPVCALCRQPLDESALMEGWKAFLAPHMTPPPYFHQNRLCHPCMDGARKKSHASLGLVRDS
ncbi:ISL3 family transposase [Sphingopyxis sp. C-1]|uniref:ISL3 family transposase n=2 Tax=unclassified Sphingopyxis TaxID=2614943 RepID=UPI0006C2BB43|nr:ISL3 family transposase [Sphingopyxis sp. C-1]GAO78963.1 il-IS_2, transposase [Sphingopyxis sp. C-1]